MFKYLSALGALLRKSNKSATKRNRDKRPRCLPRLECLEDRLAPSVSVLADRADYIGGSTAYFTASGFDPGATVRFEVVKTSITPTVVEGTWVVTDASTADLDPVRTRNGKVKTSWYVDPTFSVGASFSLSARGLSGGVIKTATTTFTDNEAANLSQAENGPPTGPFAVANWINGNLNSNDSHYGEGDTVPFQMDLTGLVGTTHTLIIQYDYTVTSGGHAYDYLTSFDRLTSNNQTVANPLIGTGISGSGTLASASSTFAIPTDNNINGVHITPAPNNNPPVNDPFVQVPGVMAMFDNVPGSPTNTITNVFYSDIAGNPASPPAQQGSALQGTITITFTTSQSEVVFAWGGHIATQLDWGRQNSASAISGSPYHMRLIALDGSGGNQDRSLKASAVAGDFIVVSKITNPSSDTTTQFPFTLTGGPNNINQSFNLTGGPSPGTKLVFGPFFDGNYTVVENVPSGWTLTNLTVLDPNGNSSTNLATATTNIVLDSGETVAATYTDTIFASTTTGTVIKDSTTNQAPSGNLGESVYDTATVTTNGLTPTGTVTYEFFNTIDGTGPHTDQVVTLSGGLVPNSAVHASLLAGSYSFIAIYSGDSNHSGSTGPVEPLIINKANTSTATVIKDATTNLGPTGTLGESIYDTATVTGAPFMVTGTVTYEFFTTINGTGSHTDQTVTLSGGLVPNSSATGALAAGSYSYIAIYSGDSNYTGSTGAVEPLTINKGSSSTTTTIVDASGGAVTGTLGESVKDTATVSGTPNAFTPTGTVTYEFFTTINGTGPHTDQTVTLSGGLVPNSTATGALAAGSYSYIAIYSGDSNYTGSTGAVEPLTINKGSSSTTTTIVDASGGAVTGTLGESVKDTATVSGTPNAFTPTGTVTYEFFTTINGTGPHTDQTVTLSGGLVPNSAVHGPLTAGSYSFIAIYSGDSNYTGSTGAVEPLTINKGSSSTTTTIVDASGGAVTGTLGESVKDTATVSGTPNAFTPTGTVTYEFFTTINGTGSHTDQTVTLSGGLVPNSAPTGALAAGSYSYIAIYSGDSNYTGSTGAVEPLTINKGSSSTTTTIVDASGGAVTGTLGESVKDTATVSGTPNAFTPTGTVTYEFFTTINGTGSHTDQTVTLSGGLVPNSTATGALAAGSYSYIAIYSGDSNYTGSTGAVEPLTINKGSSSTTTTIVDASGGAVTGTLGESVKDTATVSGTPNAFTPTGTVTYEFFTTINGTGSHTDQTVTLSGGLVPNSAVHGPLTAGSYSFIAIYSGDSNYTGSTGAVEPLTINKGSSSTTTTIVDASGGAVTGTLGESVKDTATVSGTPNAFTPTGTVTYEFFTTINGTGPHTDQTVTLSGGLVPNSAPTGALAAGSYSYIAIYSGDSNYTGSTGAVEPLTISSGTSGAGTLIKDSGGGVVTGVLGEAVFDTTVITASPFTPTGTVTYTFSGSNLQFLTAPAGFTVQGSGASETWTQTVTLNNGIVPNSATTPALPAGSYQFLAVYSGDSNYPGGTSPVEPLTINQANSTTSTVIKDATTNSTPSGNLGESVYDTTTVSGTPFAPTGTVTYEFFTTINGTGPHTDQVVTLSGGLVPNSAVHGPLTAGSYSFIAIYSGDSNYTGSTGAVEPLTINKGSSSTTTTIVDASGGAVTGTLGESVKDTATVSGTPNAFTPTGTVTYEFFTTINGTGSHTDQTVTLSGGLVPNSSATGALAAGSYSYIAIYSGDSNYTGSTGAVEPLTINKGSSSTTTTIVDASGGAVTGTLGESVKDTATVSGTPNAFTPTGTVTYEFFTTINGTGSHTDQTVTLSGGLVPNSAVHGPLTAGSYSFIAIYSGDSNYTGSTGAVEPLTINKASTSTATVINDATTNQAPTGTLGESVYDTATVSGTPFMVTGTVTYEFFTTINGTGSHTDQVVTLSGGLVPNSAVHGPLAAGSYSFIAIYSGDSNYTGSTGAVEPLTIGKSNTSTATVIKDATTNSAPTGALGESVYDTATVSGTPFTPTGTVTYEFFTTIDGTGSHTDQVVTLSGGLVPNSAVHGPLTAGSYSFIAIYSGDSNYNGSTGDVEPLTINKASTSTATVIELADTETEVISVSQGSQVQDDATVTSSNNSFTIGGTVTYFFYNTATPVPGTTVPVSTQTVPVGTDSNPTAALAAGSYSFVAVYSGDSNYIGSTGPIEPLTVLEARILLTPGSATNAVGTNHVITAEVDTSVDNVNWTPVNAAPVNFSLLNNTAGATFVGGVNSGITGVNGLTTVTIVSNSPGGVDIHGTTTFTIPGVGGSFTVSTGSNLSPSSTDAHKVYEQARILISPLTGINPVSTTGNPSAGIHTLTAEVDVTTNGITWTPQPNALVNFSLLNNNFGVFFVNNINSGNTDATGKVSVQINSNNTGTVTIQASTSFIINGVGGTLSATTGTGLPNSDNATKIYIGLTPSVNADLSKATDPEFIDMTITNISPVTLFVRSITDQTPTVPGQVLLGSLLAPLPHNFITSITATINGVPTTLVVGRAVPAGQTLDVHIIRTVQATDPTPSLFFSTFTLNTLANGTGTSVSATSSATVTIFKPSVKIALGVSKTSAKVGDTLTYTVTITNTSSAVSPDLRFNVQSGLLSNQLVGTVNRGVVKNFDTLHVFAGEAVWGPGIQKGTTVLIVNSASQVTLSKVVLAAQVGTTQQLYFGFGPVAVPPPLGFQLPAATLLALQNFAPGDQVTFSYTHVITSGDPNPLKNTFDMFFFVANNQSHPVSFPNKIHGPSNTVTTSSLLSKTLFF